MPAKEYSCRSVRDQLKGICSAAELTNENFGNILKDPAEFIYCSAEQALETRFLDALKDQNSKIHQRMSAVVVDEPTQWKPGLE